MLETPTLTHLGRSDYLQVYEPAEDTFLLLDSLEKDLERLQKMNATLCLEIGSGSGCVITFLSKLLGPSNALCLATDINPAAASATCRTAQANGVAVDCVQSGFTDAFASHFNRSVDILIFNPPYVVTGSDEVGSHSIEAAWAGGVDGREVIDRFLPSVDSLLSDKGLFYLVLINENKPSDVIKYMNSSFGFDAEIVMERTAGWEGLLVIRFQRSQ